MLLKERTKASRHGSRTPWPTTSTQLYGLVVYGLLRDMLRRIGIANSRIHTLERRLDGKGIDTACCANWGIVLSSRCRIDSRQPRLAISADGKLTSDRHSSSVDLAKLSTSMLERLHEEGEWSNWP
jgi:hypothetical protein